MKETFSIKEFPFSSTIQTSFIRISEIELSIFFPLMILFEHFILIEIKMKINVKIKP